MDKSIMTVYLNPNNLNKLEEFPARDFDNLVSKELFNTPFARYCVTSIDPNLCGVIALVSRLSGAIKTLLVAKYNPSLPLPLVNLGDNCAEALYRCSQPEPTSWFYEGYFPTVLPEQVIWFPELDVEVQGSEVKEFLRKNSPCFRKELPQQDTTCKPDIFFYSDDSEHCFSVTVQSLVTILAGNSASGKSTFLRSITKGFMHDDVVCLQYASEIDPIEVLRANDNVRYVFIDTEDAWALQRRGYLRPIYDAGYRLVIASSAPIHDLPYEPDRDVYELRSDNGVTVACKYTTREEALS